MAAIIKIKGGMTKVRIRTTSRLRGTKGKRRRHRQGQKVQVKPKLETKILEMLIAIVPREVETLPEILGRRVTQETIEQLPKLIRSIIKQSKLPKLEIRKQMPIPRNPKLLKLVIKIRTRIQRLGSMSRRQTPTM